jgi:threonine synthase
MSAFVSTRGQAPAVPLREALQAGLAPDGGLYVPARIPILDDDAWENLRGRSLPEIGLAMASAWFGDEIPPPDLARLLREALTFDTPLVMVRPGLWALELFHGPTLAFKDVGARVMARLLSYFQTGRDMVTVLVATSGDTGGAVAQAFHGVAGTRVVVLYPAGLVSPVQEAQFTTLGGNVTAVAVSGTFDDCQRLVREAFAAPELGRRLRLTSANSINIGRLLPQAFYYASAALTFPRDRPPVVSVPSGNFGNLTAGLLAWKMGVPITRFIAATNVNDVVPRYLATGRVEPRPSQPTLATAMDVGNPSNLERIRWLFRDEVNDVRRMVSGSVHTDDDVRAAIRALYRERGYVCDPHSAIAYLGLSTKPGGLRDEREPPGVFFATAHPAKFLEVVEPIIGEKLTVPRPLAESLARPRTMEHIAPELTALMPIL